MVLGTQEYTIYFSSYFTSNNLDSKTTPFLDSKFHPISDSNSTSFSACYPRPNPDSISDSVSGTFFACVFEPQKKTPRISEIDAKFLFHSSEVFERSPIDFCLLAGPKFYLRRFVFSPKLSQESCIFESSRPL